MIDPEPTQEPRFTFPATRRIKGRTEFNAVFEKGSVISDATLVLHILSRSGKPSRLGISISKKVGCSPARNRWKRLMREAFRLNQAEIPAGLDIIARPRKGAQPDYQAIEASLLSLCKRAARRRRECN